MLEGLSLASYPPLVGALAIFMFPYLQMGRGKLVPYSMVLNAVAEADKWREAHQVSETSRAKQAEVIAQLSGQVRELVVGQEALIRSTENKT